MENAFKDGTCHPRIVTEEHISVVSESACEYFCHFKTDSGSKRDIVSSLIKAMENRNVDLSKLTVTRYDGTAVNTGHDRDYENLLISMITDDQKHTHEREIRRILKVRHHPQSFPTGRTVR